MWEQLAVKLGVALAEELAKALLDHEDPKVAAKALALKLRADNRAAAAIAQKFGRKR